MLFSLNKFNDEVRLNIYFRIYLNHGTWPSTKLRLIKWVSKHLLLGANYEIQVFSFQLRHRLIQMNQSFTTKNYQHTKLYWTTNISVHTYGIDIVSYKIYLYSNIQCIQLLIGWLSSQYIIKKCCFKTNDEAPSNCIMVRSAGLCVCVFDIKICIKHIARFTLFYTNLNSADVDAR